MKLIIAEKPSVARDIAKVLGLTKKSDGCISGVRSGVEVVVTWCLGHLVGLCDPGEISPNWKSWNLSQLPMLPEKWKLKVIPRTKKQFNVVKKQLKRKDLAEVVCATDAGREGELIFRLVYNQANCKAPIKRLWISSLTDEAIEEGFRNLKDGSFYEPLFESAYSRAKADWLVGMNFSRLYSIKLGSNFSVGRVQTPTLKIIVDREIEIQNFRSRKYWSIKAKIEKPGNSGDYLGELNVNLDELPEELCGYRESFEGLYESDNGGKKRRKRTSSKIPQVKEVYDYFSNRVLNGEISVGRVSKRDKVEKPPLLHDLTDLQREANKVFGFSASETLKYAQNLYEKFKVITYPRTDSRFLTKDMSSKLPKIFSSISSNYQSMLGDVKKFKSLSSRYINDGKVTDHHAIIPTGKTKGVSGAGVGEKRIFDLICRRFLMAFMNNSLSQITNVSTFVSLNQSVDRYLSRGVIQTQLGWKSLLYKTKEKKEQDDQIFPTWLEEGARHLKGIPKYENKETKPPKRYTDASLLTMMETAGKLIDEKDLGEVIKENGIGTPATRASIVDTLIKREYVKRRGKSFHALEKGIRLIGNVYEKLASVSLTAEWEKSLESIVDGQLTSKTFDENIYQFISGLLQEKSNKHYDRNSSLLKDSAYNTNSRVGSLHTPVVKRGEMAVSNSARNKEFLDSFQLKPSQREAVNHLRSGSNILAVLPTGYGKSLIYQYAGLENGGRTLIISPLLALMHDQVSSLKRKNIGAAMLSNDMNFDDVLKVLGDFDSGRVQFLFVSPEKASSSKFIERITRTQLSLLVFDEAHCISTWGLEFRPKYRELSKLVKAASPTPVCLLSATVTNKVCSDIYHTLGLEDVKKIVHIDLPSNNKVMVEKVDESERVSRICEYFEKDESKPAVIYVPTRKLAEELSEKISSCGVTTYFHAGLKRHEKDHIQNSFLSGHIDIVVATVAFGMGINKADIRSVVHYTSPSSIESYVQEIGRGGRDGKPCKSILFFGDSDKSKLFKRLNITIPSLEVLEKFIDSESFLQTEGLSYVEKIILSKLCSFGVLKEMSGKYQFNNDSLSNEWKNKYSSYRDQKSAELNKMMNLVESDSCRKLGIQNYFLDSAVSKEGCGTCDVCDQIHSPGLVRVNKGDRKSPEYETMLAKYLQDNNGLSSTLIYQRFAKPIGLSRTDFWIVVGKLEKNKKVKVKTEKKVVRGRSISKKVLNYTGL
jgi:DNA topoisomerase-3